MDYLFGYRNDPLLPALGRLLISSDDSYRCLNPAARRYVRDTIAMSVTAVDIKEFPNSYVFEADMPGLKSEEIKKQVEECNVLVIGGKHKREEENGTLTNEVKYLCLERPAGLFLTRFTLPVNTNVDNIAAACQDGVLTVTVPKIPPPEPQQPRTIEVTSSL